MWSAGKFAAEGASALGPLTEVSGLRRAAEEFRRVSPDLPATDGSANAVPRHRQMLAERHRERGAKLVEAGRLAAAIAAFTEATRLDPRNASAHHGLGHALLESGRAKEAIDSLQLATALAEDGAGYHNLATALRRQGQNGAAIAAYRRATELAPAQIPSYLGLADVLEEAGDEESAAQSLRQAAEQAPETAVGQLCRGRVLMLAKDFVGAEAELRRAIELDPVNDLALKHLGDALVRQGRFEEAVAVFDRVLALNPRQVSAYFATVEAGKCTEADRFRLDGMLAALDDAALDGESRVKLHFAIGKLLDDLGEYHRAIEHFDTANRIRESYTTFDEVEFVVFFDRLIRRFTGAFFEANANLGHEDDTPLLIVGLPRSGTTLVEQILSRHPEISAGGELPFWIRNSGRSGSLETISLNPEAGRALAQQYLAILRAIGPSAARVTDKLPFNLLRLGVIHLLLPKARIIQCRRHPVDTCLSMYFTYFLQTIPFASSRRNLVTAYRQYARLMDHWCAVLPRERFFEVDYERLVSDRETVTRELVAFAGLEWNDACLYPERNQRPVTTASLWQARQPVYTSSVARWRNYEPWLGELRQLLDAGDRTGGGPRQ